MICEFDVYQSPQFCFLNMIFDSKLQFYQLILKGYCLDFSPSMSKILDQLLWFGMKYFQKRHSSHSSPWAFKGVTFILLIGLYPPFKPMNVWSHWTLRFLNPRTKTKCRYISIKYSLDIQCFECFIAVFYCIWLF